MKRPTKDRFQAHKIFVCTDCMIGPMTIHAYVKHRRSVMHPPTPLYTVAGLNAEFDKIMRITNDKGI